MKISKTTIEWLLETDNPPVRYLTMKNLLVYPDSKLKTVRKNINSYKAIKGILKHHQTFWGKDPHLYRKYKGGYWNLIFLGDMFADGRDPLIKNGIEFVLNDNKWQDFLHKGDTHWICLPSNILRAMSTLGYADDSRVLDLIERAAKVVIANNGIKCAVMNYSMHPYCIMAIPKALMMFGTYAGNKRIVKQAIKLLSEQLLKRKIFRYVPDNNDEWVKHYERIQKQHRASRSSLPKQQIVMKEELAKIRPGLWKKTKSFNPKPGWLKFGYPLHYNSDVLESMRSLLDAGVKDDKRMNDALDVIQQAAEPDGRWKMKFSLNGKMWIDIEKRGQPSKWITYHALRVMNNYRQISIV